VLARRYQRCTALRYATALLVAKKAIFDATSPEAQRSGRTLAPCARSVSADPWNCANATLKAKKRFEPCARSVSADMYIASSHLTVFQLLPELDKEGSELETKMVSRHT
jgi:hypothetical protein